MLSVSIFVFSQKIVVDLLEKYKKNYSTQRVYFFKWGISGMMEWKIQLKYIHICQNLYHNFIDKDYNSSLKSLIEVLKDVW